MIAREDLIWTADVNSSELGGAGVLTGEPPGQPISAQLVDGHVPHLPPSWPVRVWLAGSAAMHWLFGLASLLVALSLLATVPILQFASLGYLLEVSGRIARTGRFRSGFIGVEPMARLGGIVLGTWLILWPLRFLADLWYSAQLIDPSRGPAVVLRVVLLAATALFVLHVVIAWFCGGKLRHFFWPLLAPVLWVMWLTRRLIASTILRAWIRPIVNAISPRFLADVTAVPPLASWFPPAILLAAWRRGGMVGQARDAVWEFIVSLRLPYYFSLGARGFLGAAIWLFVPALLMMGMTRLPILVSDNEASHRGLTILAGLSGFFGTAAMAVVLLYLPFLQTHLASENRFRAVFEIGVIRKMFRRAPWAFAVALVVTLLFALPLYLLKIEYAPREILWIPNFVFVVFLYPARLLTGWALARARRRDLPRFFLSRWLARFAVIPVVGFYVLVLFLTQYVSWEGAWSLWEQHPFLLPAPFFGL